MRKFKIIWISILFGLLYGIIDAAVDSIVFERGDFFTDLISPGAPDMWMRAFTMFVLIVFSIVAQHAISRRKETEKILTSGERFLNDIFSSMQDGICVLDKDMNIMRVNPIMEKWYEHAMPVVGKKCYQAYHCRETPCDICPSRRTLQTGKAVYEIVPKTGKGGKILGWQDLYSFPMIDTESGKLIGVIEYVRDITDRKWAEDALIESEKKYRMLFEESKDVIYISTPDGRFIDINPVGAELFGYHSAEEMLSLDIAKDIYFNPEDRTRFKQKVSETGFVKDFETVMKKKDGERLNVLITATAQKDEDGNIVFYRGIIRDITEHKKLEAQLLHAQKIESIGQLAGGVAHDFNNILTAIIGYASLLKMKMPESDPLRPHVEAILSSSDRAAHLTQSLLAFGRKQIIDLHPININSIIQRVEQLLVRVIGEDIDLKTALSNKELIVLADSGQIEQVLMNLATNARDALPDGGQITIETEQVTIDKEFTKIHPFMQPGDYSLISFTDTGEGMDEQTKAKIFEPFFTTKEMGKGTGLGLSIVYGIIKQHTGYITVYSEQGKGTTFKIYLPLISSQTEDEKQKNTETPSHGRETILIGEDDESVRSIIRSVLEEFDYKVIEAQDGEEALEKYKQHKEKINLLILDVIMPKKDGRELFEEIRKIDPMIKVIFTSGYTLNVIKRKGILREDVPFLPKPISPSELLKKVREALDK